MSSNPLIDFYEQKMENEFVNSIKHHIRNIQVLNEVQMQYIKTLPPETKNELFEIYNDCIRLFNDIMNG